MGECMLLIRSKLDIILEQGARSPAGNVAWYKKNSLISLVQSLQQLRGRPILDWYSVSLYRRVTTTHDLKAMHVSNNTQQSIQVPCATAFSQ